MKFKQYISRISDAKGMFPTPELRWVIRKNPSKTAREEAIAASVIQQANPRKNITGHFPWGPEEQMVLQQLWISTDYSDMATEWRDVPVAGASELFSVEGDLNIPNAVKEPDVVTGDFHQRLCETLEDDF